MHLYSVDDGNVSLFKWQFITLDSCRSVIILNMYLLIVYTHLQLN